MRLKVEQRRNEQHEEQLRVELHIREERHLRGDETEHDLHERRGDARQEAAQERGEQHGAENAQDENENAHRLPFCMRGVCSRHGPWPIF